MLGYNDVLQNSSNNRNSLYNYQHTLTTNMKLRQLLQQYPSDIWMQIPSGHPPNSHPSLGALFMFVTDV